MTNIELAKACVTFLFVVAPVVVIPTSLRALNKWATYRKMQSAKQALWQVSMGLSSIEDAQRESFIGGPHGTAGSIRTPASSASGPKGRASKRSEKPRLSRRQGGIRMLWNRFKHRERSGSGCWPSYARPQQVYGTRGGPEAS
jgi:hypothetical protein